MAITVQLPDGSTAEFPDGTDHALIEKTLASHAKDNNLSWSDVPGQALKNALPSAGNFVKGIAQPFLHPIDTATGLANIGYGLASKAYGASGLDTRGADEKAADEATVDAIGHHFKDRYGSVEGLKRTLATDPVGAAADASMVLTGGSSLPARVPGAVGKAAQAVGTVGRAIDPIGATANTVGAAANLGKQVVGMTSGVGAMPLEAAFSAGRMADPKFGEYIRGIGDPQKIVKAAEDAYDVRKAEASAEYNRKMAATRADTKPLDIRPIIREMNKLDDEIAFKGFSKSPTAQKALNEIRNVVRDFWKLPQPERTAEAFDALKQRIGDVSKSYDPITQANAKRVADRLYNKVKDEIVKQVPDYADAMKVYSEGADAAKETRDALSVGGKASNDTKLRKLTSVMRNNVNTNYGARARVLDDLAKTKPGESLPAMIAGSTLSAWHPRGLAVLGPVLAGVTGAATFNPTTAAMLPLMSPRLLGNVAYGAGRTAKAIDDIGGLIPGSSYARPAIGYGYTGANAVRAMGLLDQLNAEGR